MQHLPVKTQCFLQFGISCELGNRKKWDGKHKGCTYLWEHNVWCALGISCELGNNKMGRETDRRHLLVKSQCFTQFGIRSAAWRVMLRQQKKRPKDVKTSARETVPTGVRGMPHTPVGTVDGRNIQTPSIRYNPSPPKFNVNVAWSALAPMDEKNQTPNITFANTRAETLRFGGAGVQHSACCRVWIFCPSTVGLVFAVLTSQVCDSNTFPTRMLYTKVRLPSKPWKPPVKKYTKYVRGNEERRGSISNIFFACDF